MVEVRISGKVGGWGLENMKKVGVITIDVAENPCRLSIGLGEDNKE